MFVRLIDKDGLDILRECDSVAMRPLGDDRVLVTLARHEVEIANLDVEKKNGELYIMNNEGRTIDHYRWVEPVARSVAAPTA